MISSAVDILNLIAEFNSSILRDYIIQTKESVNEASIKRKGEKNTLVFFPPTG